MLPMHHSGEAAQGLSVSIMLFVPGPMMGGLQPPVTVAQEI